MARYDVDPDGDVLATLSEPSGPFAPSAQVGDPVPVPSGDHDRPATENGIVADENAGTAEDADIEKDDVQTTAPPTEYRLRLSSKHLMLASPSLRKMYSGDWKETTLRDEDGLLSWDVGDLFDPNAFIIVMNVVHGLNRKVPRAVDLELLAKIAVIVDYLQCHESMDVFSAIWIDGLRSSLPGTYGRELILWIMVSSIFRDQEVFGTATRTAILNAREEVPSVGLPIHQRIISMMEEQRQVLLGMLLNAPYCAAERLRSGICDDSCDSLLLGSLIKQCKTVDLFQSRQQHGPTRGLSVAGVAADIASLSTPTWYHPEDVGISVGYSPPGGSKYKGLKKKKDPLCGLYSPGVGVSALMRDNRHPCTLYELFSEIHELEAGVKGLDLEAISS